MPLYIYSSLSFIGSGVNTKYSRWTIFHPTKSNWQISAKMLNKRSPNEESENLVLDAITKFVT